MESIRAVDGERPFTDTHFSDLRHLGIGLVLVDRILCPIPSKNGSDPSARDAWRPHGLFTVRLCIGLNDQMIIPVRHYSSTHQYSSPMIDSTQEPL